MVSSDEWKNQAHGAIPGSIVTIILVGHSDESGIYAGDKPLGFSNLAGACAEFQTNVQIYLAIKACSSELCQSISFIGQTNLYLHTSSKDEVEKR